jgi:hypothetical protein
MTRPTPATNKTQPRPLAHCGNGTSKSARRGPQPQGHGDVGREKDAEQAGVPALGYFMGGGLGGPRAKVDSSQIPAATADERQRKEPTVRPRPNPGRPENMNRAKCTGKAGSKLACPRQLQFPGTRHCVGGWLSSTLAEGPDDFLSLVPCYPSANLSESVFRKPSFGMLVNRLACVS